MDNKDNKDKPSRDSLLKPNGTRKEDIQKAHSEADKDIANDPDLSVHSPNDDLDEGESARLGEKG